MVSGYLLGARQNKLNKVEEELGVCAIASLMSFTKIEYSEVIYM